MSAAILILALLFRTPVYHCNADLYIPEHPCASSAASRGDVCVVLKGRILCS